MSETSRAGAAPLDWIVLAAAAVAFVFFVAIPGQIAPDFGQAREYIAFADAFLTGELFAGTPANEISRGLATRTPGYPALLALAKLATTDNTVAVRGLHAAIGLLVLLYVPLALRRICPVWITAPVVLFVQWRMHFYLTVPLTEWTSFNLLLVLFASSVRYWDAPSYARLACLGLVSAYLILTRPALVIVAAMPAALAMLQNELPRLRALVVGFAPFVLVLLWMAFNFWRLGSFTLTPFAGMNLLGVSTIVGHADEEPGDSPELRALIQELNAQKKPPVGQQLNPDSFGENTLAWIYNWNVHQVGEEIRRRHGWDAVTYDRLLVTYGRRALRSHPAAYFEYVVRELEKLRSALPLLIPALLLPVLWLERRRNRGLALAALAMLVLHAVHVLLCALVEVVIPRYEALTYYPLLAASLVAGAVFVLPYLEELTTRRSRASA